jgi:hypothetical protein
MWFVLTRWIEGRITGRRHSKAVGKLADVRVEVTGIEGRITAEAQQCRLAGQG